MAFNEEQYRKRQKSLEDQMKGLNAEKARAERLWAEHVEPLAHEDRVLLLQLLNDYLHGED